MDYSSENVLYLDILEALFSISKYIGLVHDSQYECYLHSNCSSIRDMKISTVDVFHIIKTVQKKKVPF